MSGRALHGHSNTAWNQHKQVQSRKLTAVSYSKAVASYLCILQLCSFVVSSSVYLCCILRLYCPIRCSDLWDVSKTTATIQSDATRVTSCHILTCQSSNESNGSSVWTQQLRNAKTHISYGHATVDSMTVWHRDCIQRLHKELWKCKGKVRQTFQLVSADVLVSRKSLAAINHPIWMHSRTTCYTQKSESELLGNSMLNSAFRRH